MGIRTRKNVEVLYFRSSRVDPINVEFYIFSKIISIYINLNYIKFKAFHSKKLLPLKKSTAKPLLQLKQYKYGIKKLRADRDRSLESKNVLRSPIVKRLLRISNSIQCEAKDECEDKCKNKFNGKKVIKCEMQCEVKYECEEEEEEEEKDPCENGGCQDSCGDSAECTMSTKGEKLTTEEPSCKRC